MFEFPTTTRIWPPGLTTRRSSIISR